MIGCVVVEEMSDPLDADDKTCNLWLTAQHLLTYCDIMLLLLFGVHATALECIGYNPDTLPTELLSDREMTN